MNHQINSEINDDAIRKLFKEKNLVFMSTLMKDGSPQVTPTWVDIENGSILVNTVSRDPRVALAITDHNNPYDMVTIRGKVIEQITGDEAEKHIDKLAKKYIGAEKYPGRSATEKRVILKIKPEKVFHMKQ